MFRNKSIAFITVILVLNSCASPALLYTYETGKHLDFSSGKWLINKVNTNKPNLSNKLYHTAYKSFYEILGDKLYDINRVRINHIVKSDIKHNLNKNQLIQLGKDSECDYLINIEGIILTDNIDFINFQSDIDKSATNKSTSNIKIYDLNNGILISSISAESNLSIGKDLLPDRSNDDGNKEFPSFYRSASFGLNKSIKKLVKKHKKHALKN